MHIAFAQHKFSRGAFTASRAYSPPYRQRRLLVPLGRNSHALAPSVATFGLSVPLHVRCGLALHQTPCRFTNGLAAPEFGKSVAVKRPRVPLGGRCSRHTPRRVDGCEVVSGDNITLSGAAASLLAAVSTPVAAPRVVAVSALAAPHFVGNAFAPTLQSTGPAQKAAQAGYFER